jgi:uncharacterized protein YyaL (SSP411 family)
VYLHTWQVTGEPFCCTITEGTLDYVVCEMTSPGGGFCSTQDADRGGGRGGRGNLEEREALAQARRRLSEVRKSRVHPGRDNEVLTSWNRLMMLAAFGGAARVLEAVAPGVQQVRIGSQEVIASSDQTSGSKFDLR